MAVRELAPVGPKSWLSWRHLAVKFPNDKIDLETEKLSHLSILSEVHRLKVGSRNWKIKKLKPTEKLNGFLILNPEAYTLNFTDFLSYRKAEIFVGSHFSDLQDLQNKFRIIVGSQWAALSFPPNYLENCGFTTSDTILFSDSQMGINRRCY